LNKSMRQKTLTATNCIRMAGVDLNAPLTPQSRVDRSIERKRQVLSLAFLMCDLLAMLHHRLFLRLRHRQLADKSSACR
jgi:hypothetical protein